MQFPSFSKISNQFGIFLKVQKSGLCMLHGTSCVSWVSMMGKSWVNAISNISHDDVIHMLKWDKNISIVGSWVESSISEITLWQTLWLPLLYPLTALLPSWQGGLLSGCWPSLCSGKWMNADWSKPTMMVPFPLPLLGLDMSMWHDLAKETKGTSYIFKKGFSKRCPSLGDIWRQTALFFCFCFYTWLLEDVMHGALAAILWYEAQMLRMVEGKELGGWLT